MVQNPFYNNQMAILIGFFVLLTSMEGEFVVAEMPVYFSKGEATSQRDFLFGTDGLHSMLEENDFQFMEMLFPFSRFLQNILGELQDSKSAEVEESSLLHSKPVCNLYSTRRLGGKNDKCIAC